LSNFQRLIWRSRYSFASDTHWFIQFDGSREHLIIRTVRFPRSLLAMLVGAAMSTAGAIMQGVARNPLADPGILGVNAGAAFAVVISIFLFGTSAPSVYIWCAFIGAGVTVSVYHDHARSFRITNTFTKGWGRLWENYWHLAYISVEFVDTPRAKATGILIST
jgi:ABC-type Fe3+-siderophore transport system permease subunit